MIVKQISPDRFKKFSNDHILKNMYQTKEYGMLMSRGSYEVMYIGGFAGSELRAASLILYKSLGRGMKYGYAPRGFLIDYYDTQLLASFTKAVKEYFYKKGFAFIKINPEVSLSILDYNAKSKSINVNSKDLVMRLKGLGYDKLKDNLYFESLLPRYTPVISLKSYDLASLNGKLLSDVKECETCGVHIRNGSFEDIEKFYPYVKDKDTKTIAYYKHFYKAFASGGKVDLLFAELNYNDYVKHLQKDYAYAQEKNEKINSAFNQNPTDEGLYNLKMESDEVLNKIAANINVANVRMDKETKSEVLGTALVVKHEGRVTVYIAGVNKTVTTLDIKSFLYYKIIEEYQKAGYLFLDMNGITADFTDSNPYKALNDFKLSFNPTVYEYIGEYDLIINKTFHQILWSTNKIQKEFFKPAVKQKAEM